MPRTRTRTPEANRRPDIEEFLLKYNVTHTYKEDVSPKLFNMELSLRNQARLGTPLDPDTVRTYVVAFGEGAKFPPVLAHQVGDSLVALDGNHRTAAALEAGASLDVYVCEAPPQILTMITFMANTKHGKPPSPEDRLHHALYLVDGGLTISDAAAAMSLPVGDLRKAILRQQAVRRADDAGVLRTDWDRIPAAAKARLGSIITDEGFKAAVSLIKDAGLSGEEVTAMVATMNESRSGRKQKEIAANLRLAYAERIAEVAVSGSTNRPGFRSSSPRSRLASVVGMVVALPPLATYADNPPPEPTRSELAKRVDEAVYRLMEIRETLT